MLTLHHLNNSRSQRVLWLLEELQIPYEIKFYQRDPVSMLAPPSLKAVHPLGKSPVITDGDKTIAESGAILEYLVETYGNGRFRPAPGTPEALRYRYFMHYAEGSAMPPLLLKLLFGRLGKPPMPALIRPVARLIAKGMLERYVDPQLRNHMQFMEGELADRPWFAGDEMTTADFQMSFPLEAAKARGQLEGKTNLLAFLERIHARDAYRRALDKGGEYALMGSK